MTPAPLRFDTVADAARFDTLAAGWDELVGAMVRPSPFLLHGWISAWLRHFAAGSTISVQTAWRGDELVAALPFVRRRSGGLVVSKFAGGRQSNLADVLLAAGEPASTAAAVVDRARAGHDYAQLHGVREEARIVEAAAGSLALFRRIDAPVVDVGADWDAALAAKLSGRRRAKLRQKRRHLERLGPVKTMVAQSPEAVDAALGDVFRMHELRWAGRPDGSGFATPAGQRFHREALRALAARGTVRLAILRGQRRAVAFALYLVVGNRWYGYRQAFDPAFARESPGVLLLLDDISAAAAEGVTCVELLGAAEGVKLELADRLDPLYLALGLPGTHRGALVVGARVRGLGLRERLRTSTRVAEAYDHIRPWRDRLRRRGNVLSG